MGQSTDGHEFLNFEPLVIDALEPENVNKR